MLTNRNSIERSPADVHVYTEKFKMVAKPEIGLLGAFPWHHPW